MEHVDNALQCMKELHRVLKPGGWGIMQVPQDFNRQETLEDSNIVSPEDREKYYWQKDHVRLFGLDYPKWLEKAGFTVTEFIKESNYNEKQITRFRLQKEEILKLEEAEKVTRSEVDKYQALVADKNN